MCPSEMVFPHNVGARTGFHIRALTKYMASARRALFNEANESQTNLDRTGSEEEYQDAWNEHHFLYENAYLPDTQPHYSAMDQHLVYSILPMVYMVFESQTLSCCREVQRDRGLPVGADDLKGNSGAERAKRYLNKLINVSIGDYEEWPDLMDLRQIRNCIVHDAGHLRNQELIARLPALQARFPGDVSTVNDYFADDPILLVRIGPCEHYLTVVERYFERLFNDCGIRGKLQTVNVP